MRELIIESDSLAAQGIRQTKIQGTWEKSLAFGGCFYLCGHP
jgi:hypothetical protein